MLNITWYLRDRLRCPRDERGIETLEWCLVGGLITAVCLLIYPGVLGPGLTTAINAIIAAIVGAMPGAA